MTADRTSQIPSMFRFSLDDVPERDRMAMMFDYFGRHMRRIQVEVTDPDAPLQCDAEVRIVQDVSWGIARMSKVSARRLGALMEDGCDDIMLFAPSCGVTVSPQGGEAMEIRPRSVLLMSQARAAVTAYHGPAETFAFRFSRARLRDLVPSLGEAPCAEIQDGMPGLDLLFSYGRLLHADPLADAVLQRQAALHLQQLASLVIGASGDAAEHVRQTGVAAARVATIKADIRENIGRRDLSVGAVAARHGITPRYLHMVFEREEKSFSEFVAAERLEKAYQFLSDPRRSRSRHISDLAFALGFLDISTFNRQFKRQYGITPSELRNSTAK